MVVINGLVEAKLKQSTSVTFGEHSKMENLKEFLDTSTIHGLSWISSTKRISRVFWTIVVISGFTTAIVMILQSFDNWKDQPITTTIETLRLSKLTLPNITICPPKHTATNLNFDIMEADKMVLSKESRKEILDYAIEVYQEDNHKEMMKNLSQIHEEDRGFNWYHGYSKIRLPYSPYCYRWSSIDFCTNQLVYSIYILLRVQDTFLQLILMKNTLKMKLKKIFFLLCTFISPEILVTMKI